MENRYEMSESSGHSSPTPAIFSNKQAEEYNALQCQLIAMKRSNDVLVLENNKLRMELEDALDRLSVMDTRSQARILELTQALEESEERHTIEMDAKTKEYATNFEKIREYTANLLKNTRNKYQTRVSVMKNNFIHYQQNDKKEREELERVWQQRMEEYRSELTIKFQGLLESVATIQENKRKHEEEYILEMKSLNNIIDNLKLENRTFKEKEDAIKQTLEQFKENNNLLREKLQKREETVNILQLTVKKGIEERAELETTIADMKKKLKVTNRKNEKPTNKESEFLDLSKNSQKDLSNGDTGSVCSRDGSHRDTKTRSESHSRDTKPSGTNSRDTTIRMKSMNKLKSGGCSIAGQPVKRSYQPVWK
uniref:Uncharacterized protein n=1 Tax=Cacopsylla melanoneura TaxID=428564 RepID=A0A8D8ZME7_9HEMI